MRMQVLGRATDSKSISEMRGRAVGRKMMCATPPPQMSCGSQGLRGLPRCYHTDHSDRKRFQAADICHDRGLISGCPTFQLHRLRGLTCCEGADRPNTRSIQHAAEETLDRKSVV